jgi:maltose O-acetyltransferase
MESTGSGQISRRLRIRTNTFINVRIVTNLNVEIRIGTRVSTGHHVIFITAEHEVGAATSQPREALSASILIDDGYWIGARSAVLPGANNRKSTVVAVGSAVSGKLRENRVFGGVPARAVKALPCEP